MTGAACRATTCRENLVPQQDFHFGHRESVIVFIPLRQAGYGQTNISSGLSCESEDLNRISRTRLIFRREVKDGSIVEKGRIVGNIQAEPNREQESILSDFTKSLHRVDFDCVEFRRFFETDLNPFLMVGGGFEFAVISEVGGDIIRQKSGQCDPFRFPVGRLKKSHLPESGPAVLRRFRAIAPHANLPVISSPALQWIPGIGNLNGLIGLHTPGIPGIRLLVIQKA